MEESIPDTFGQPVVELHCTESCLQVYLETVATFGNPQRY